MKLKIPPPTKPLEFVLGSEIVFNQPHPSPPSNVPPLRPAFGSCRRFLACPLISSSFQEHFRVCPKMQAVRLVEFNSLMTSYGKVENPSSQNTPRKLEYPSNLTPRECRPRLSSFRMKLKYLRLLNHSRSVLGSEVVFQSTSLYHLPSVPRRFLACPLTEQPSGTFQ
ncbi:hypothetical protein CEXT_684491 [Caerostris extrusa]|uniref:Uncharacterized protein n=1 Tax=Caerostris extrusa TaxID=172846 RepID=A0AAV4R2W2_CAEEX|nr:hypothetical protein CEXT_684491 [Caerostris extrusa]